MESESEQWTMDVPGDGVQLISRVLVTFASARRKCRLDIAAHHNTLLLWTFPRVLGDRPPIQALSTLPCKPFAEY